MRPRDPLTLRSGAARDAALMQEAPVEKKAERWPMAPPWAYLDPLCSEAKEFGEPFADSRVSRPKQIQQGDKV